MRLRPKHDAERPPTVLAFLAELAEVCKRHGLSIGHEDEHGAFEVCELDDRHIDWLLAAIDCTELERKAK